MATAEQMEERAESRTVTTLRSRSSDLQLKNKRTLRDPVNRSRRRNRSRPVNPFEGGHWRMGKGTATGREREIVILCEREGWRERRVAVR